MAANCVHCGGLIPEDTKATKYCSRVCSKAHWQQVNIERQREANRRCHAKYRDQRVAARAVKREANREDVRAKNKMYRSQNADYLRALDRLRNAVKRDERIAYMREYNQRPEVKAHMREYRAANKARLSEKLKQWGAANRDKLRALWDKGRARRVGHLRGGDTIDRQALFQRDKWTCQLCGGRAPKRLIGTRDPFAPTIDHIIPLSKGGPHTWDNVQCAHARCNMSKRATLKGQLRIPLGSAPPTSNSAAG